MPYSEEYKSDKFVENDKSKIYKIINAYKDNGVIDGYVSVGTNCSQGIIVKYDSKFNIVKTVTYDCNCDFSTIIPAYSADGILDGLFTVSCPGF